MKSPSQHGYGRGSRQAKIGCQMLDPSLGFLAVAPVKGPMKGTPCSVVIGCTAFERGSHFADQSKYPVFIEKLICFGNRDFRFVIVIVRDQLELAAMNVASGIHLMERR